MGGGHGNASWFVRGGDVVLRRLCAMSNYKNRVLMLSNNILVIYSASAVARAAG